MQEPQMLIRPLRGKTEIDPEQLEVNVQLFLHEKPQNQDGLTINFFEGSKPSTGWKVALVLMQSLNKGAALLRTTHVMDNDPTIPVQFMLFTFDFTSDKTATAHECIGVMHGKQHVRKLSELLYSMTALENYRNSAD